MAIDLVKGPCHWYFRLLTWMQSVDGRFTATGHENGGVYIFNNDTGRLLHSLPGSKALHKHHSKLIISSRSCQTRSSSCLFSGR